jgi:putative endonuclease
MHRRHRGEQGEQRAENFLVDRGLRLVERNYQCRSGEIDLVMLDPNPSDTEVLAFVEVRLRGPGARVDSIDSVDERKQRKLATAARHFLMAHPQWQEHACRFDVVGIDGEEGRLRWIPGAFELPG